MIIIITIIIIIYYYYLLLFIIIIYYYYYMFHVYIHWYCLIFRLYTWTICRPSANATQAHLINASDLRPLLLISIGRGLML